MPSGPLRSELEKLGADLAKGTPLREAVRARKLPDLYRTDAGGRNESNDLPAVLTMLADDYQRRQNIGTRLKGFMVYPAIALFAAPVLSCLLSFLFSSIVGPAFQPFFWGPSPNLLIGIWVPPLLLGLASALLCYALAAGSVRRRLQWRLPAFKEASLARVASALALMLKNGVSLDKSLSLVEKLEEGTPAETELAGWRQRLSGGGGKFSEIAGGRAVFPPLFVWLVGQSGEDLPGGFQRAAEIYQNRAVYRAETLLYSALPCSVLALGMVIMCQIQPVLATFISFMNALTNLGA